ncbi:MAG: PD-(D/E)XK nuclease family protein [Finegoldia sp.]|uniref:PD-(D/E)XK nuclease family protein n=1 Tax=Finegoldia sp. TaxID=1981334 RepID=UPI003995ED03
MNKRVVYTNSNSSKLFDENISFLENQIIKGNTDFILILPNRKLIKNIRNKFLKEQSVLCDVKIWTIDDLANASDISTYLTDLIVRLAIQDLIDEGEFDDNKFFNSKGIINSSKKFISSCKYSNKNLNDLDIISDKDVSLSILSKVYEKYQNIMKQYNLLDKFDAYEIKNLNIQKNKDIYIHGFSEFRPIELEVIKQLKNYDVNVYIYVDYYNEYKSKLVNQLEDIGFEVIESAENFETNNFIEKKIVKLTNEILEKDRLIDEICKDSYEYDYNKMAILIERDSSKIEILNSLKSHDIPVFGDDYISYQNYKIFSDIINILDKSKTFKQYVFSILDSCFVEFDLKDKISFRSILVDFEFDNWESLDKILKSNLNYENNLQILNKIKFLYSSFIETDIDVIKNLISLLEKKESDEIEFNLFTEKLLLILEDLDKTYCELVKKSKNLNEYLIDLIKNLRVDSTNYLVDGIRIYSLTDIRLSNYDVLYIVNMNDDVIPGKVNYDFFYNEENIKFLQNCGVDILSDADNRKRNIDRFVDAINRANKKVYMSYNTENSIKSRLILDKNITSNQKIKKLKNKNIRKIDTKKLHSVSSYEKYSLKQHLNRLETRIMSKDISDFEVDDKTTQYILNKELSPTQLETYFECPMKFYFRYYLKLKPQVKSRQLDIGTILHNTLEEFYGINISQIKDAIDGKCELDLSSLDSLLKNSFEKFGLNTDIKENEFDYDKYLFKLKDFIKEDIYNNRQEAEKFYPYKLEEDFIVSLDENTKFIGRIDRVDKTDSGKIRLIDYKLSQNSFRKAKDLAKNKGFQFAIYSSYGNVVSCKYKSIKDNEEYEYLQSINKDELDEIMNEKVKEFRENIRNKRLFIKANDYNSCNYCDYNKICKLKNTEGEAIDD